jgi:hypothetical protein
MRSWSKSVYVIDGAAKEVKELYELMKDLGSRKEPFIKNGFGTKWLGCMVDALGKDWNEVSCRGEWANLEINGDTLRFTTETAWTPCNEVLDFACQFFRHPTTIIRRKNRDVSFIVSNNSLLKKGYIFTDMPFLCC